MTKKERNSKNHIRRVSRNHAKGLCYECGDSAGGFFRCEPHRKRLNARRNKVVDYVSAGGISYNKFLKGLCHGDHHPRKSARGRTVGECRS